jgi:hypothetical protein
MKKLGICLSIAALLTLTFIVTCKVFDSNFAEATIDWFAFLAGIFLMVEAIYKLATDKAANLTNKSLRIFRAVIGTCVFTIHLLQFMRF